LPIMHPKTKTDLVELVRNSRQRWNDDADECRFNWRVPVSLAHNGHVPLRTKITVQA
jgi:hypothetical protein